MCGQLFISVVLFLISSECYLCFLGFPTQWVWEQRSHRTCCCELLHLYMLWHLVVALFPFASRYLSLSFLSLSQNWLSGTCITGMHLLAWFPWTKHRCSEFLATSFTRTHTHSGRQTLTAPPQSHLPRLAGLVGAHARTCSPALWPRHLSDRESLPLCSHQLHSEGQTISDSPLSWVDFALLDIEWNQVGTLAGWFVFDSMI